MNIGGNRGWGEGGGGENKGTRIPKNINKTDNKIKLVTTVICCRLFGIFNGGVSQLLIVPVCFESTITM